VTCHIITNRKIWKEKSSENILKCFSNFLVVLRLCVWSITLMVKEVTNCLAKSNAEV
jgi:hypothetical protein